MWTRLVRALDDPRLRDEALATNAGRSRHRDAVLGILSERFAAACTMHWVTVLAAAGVPCAPVNTLDAALRDPQVAARGLVVTASHPGYGDYRCVRGPLPALAGSAGTEA